MNPMDIVNSFNEKMDSTNNYGDSTPLRTANNNSNLIPISETKNKLDEEDDKFSPRRTLSKGFASPRKNGSQIQVGISEKEKRAILEYYRNLYSFKKPNIIKNNPTSYSDKKFPSFPLIIPQNKHNLTKIKKKLDNIPLISYENQHLKTTHLFYDNENKNSDEIETEKFNTTKKKSMFRSSIFSNLMPNGNAFSYDNRSHSYQNTRMNENETDNEKFLKTNNQSKAKIKNSNTTYGPFLHIDNKFDKKIEIKNPEIKRSLEDINYYGPHFSHCPICRYKNLDFYQTMEPHQCLKLLNYIKLKRSKIHVK